LEVDPEEESIHQSVLAKKSSGGEVASATPSVKSLSQKIYKQYDDQMEDYRALLRSRLQERNLIYTFDEFLHAMKVYSLTLVPQARQQAFHVDVKVYFEIMGKEHDRVNLEVLFQSLLIDGASRSQLANLLFYIVKELSLNRINTQALWVAQRLRQEIEKNCEDKFILMSTLEYIKVNYCTPEGKAKDEQYCKGKGARIKDHCSKAKKSLRKHGLRANLLESATPFFS